MIDKEKIKQLIEKYLEGTSLFLTGLIVKPGNFIHVTIDSDFAISIQECEKLSRHLEKQLDRNVEDFELTISSHGLTNPLILPRQYRKYINKKLIVHTHKGEKFKGKLLMVDEQKIILEKIEKLDTKNKHFIEIEINFKDISKSLPEIEF